jgi:hypothetical protein
MKTIKPTPESVIQALDVHKANGLIRDWHHNANAPWPKGGTQRPFWVVVELAHGSYEHEQDLKTLREASIFCNAMTSAHLAILRHERAWWPIQPTDDGMSFRESGGIGQ